MELFLRLGLLVSQDSDADGSISAKPFIDNMIHVISECLAQTSLVSSVGASFALTVR